MRAWVDKSCLCFAGSHANSTSHGVSYGEFWGLHFRRTIGFLIVWLNWYRTCMIGCLAQGTGGNELFDGWYYSDYMMLDKNLYQFVAVCIFDEKQFIGPQYSLRSDWHIMWFAFIKGLRQAMTWHIISFHSCSFIQVSLIMNKYRIMYVLEWWTVYALTRGLFWCLFPELRTAMEINTKIILDWVHKQFVTRVHTLFYFLHNIMDP